MQKREENSIDIRSNNRNSKLLIFKNKSNTNVKWRVKDRALYISLFSFSHFLLFLLFQKWNNDTRFVHHVLDEMKVTLLLSIVLLFITLASAAKWEDCGMLFIYWLCELISIHVV